MIVSDTITAVLLLKYPPSCKKGYELLAEYMLPLRSGIKQSIVPRLPDGVFTAGPSDILRMTDYLRGVLFSCWEHESMIMVIEIAKDLPRKTNVEKG